MLAQRAKGEVSTIHFLLGLHSEVTDEKTQIIEVDQSNEESVKMEYKDMSKYREGREQSKVAQTWLKSYKENFIDGLIGKDTPAEEIVRTLIWGFNIRHESQIAETVATFTIQWLDSPTGRSFLREVFGDSIPAEAKQVPMTETAKNTYEEMYEKEAPETAPSTHVYDVWKRSYEQMVMTNIIYRYDNSQTVSDEVYNAVHQGAPETAEIVSDTLIGWLNSHVGRCFINDAFEVDIPKHDPEGND